MKGIWGHRWDMRTEMVHRDMEEYMGTEQWDVWTELGEGDRQGETETTVRCSVWGQKRKKTVIVGRVDGDRERTMGTDKGIWVQR
jgi:hypothetical protein